MIEEETVAGLVPTFKPGALEEVERWVLSWGAHGEVLGPAILKRRIVRVAKLILARTT